MAKSSPEAWDKAKALYERGDSLRDIEKATGIPYKTIDNRAKKQGWGKGILAQHISDSVRVKTEFGTLGLAQQEVVAQEVDERTKHIQFFNNATVKNLSIMLTKIKPEVIDKKTKLITDAGTSINEHRVAQAAIKDGRETVLGKDPSTAIQVNDNSDKGGTWVIVGGDGG